MVDMPQGTPGSRQGNIQLVPPEAQPHAAQGVDASGAHHAVEQLGAAWKQLGTVMEGLGNEYEKTYEFIQGIRNHTDAANINYGLNTKLDNNTENWVANNEGLNARDHLAEYHKSVDDTVHEAINSAPNPQVKELVTQEATTAGNRVKLRTSWHAAQEERKANDVTAKTAIGAQNSMVASDPLNDDIFNDAVNKTAGASISYMTAKGMLAPDPEKFKDLTERYHMPYTRAAYAASPDINKGAANEFVKRAVGELWKTRFQKLIDQGEATKARDMYELNKERKDWGGIHETLHDDFEKMINAAEHTQIPSRIAEAAASGQPMSVSGADLGKLKFTPQTNQAIFNGMNLAKEYLGRDLRLTFEQYQRIAAIESSGDPSAAADTGSYKGLYQMGRKEWDKWARPGDKVYDAESNARAAIIKMESEARQFEALTGKRASFFDYYMIHQRGLQGHIEAVKNPGELEWQVMNRLEPGRGEKWAKLTVSKNGPFNPETTTARQFNDYWAWKLGTGASREMTTGLPKYDVKVGEAQLGKYIKAAGDMAEAYRPSDPQFRKIAEDATESRIRRDLRVYNDKTEQLVQTLTQKVNKDETRDWTELMKDKDFQAGFAELQQRDPERSEKVRSAFIARSRPELRHTDMDADDKTYMSQMTGMWMSDGEKFRTMDFSKDAKAMHLPQSQFDKLLDMQIHKYEDEAKRSELPNVRARAEGLLKDAMGTVLGKRNDHPELYQRFIGELIPELQEMERRSGGKPLNDDDILKVGQRLLGQIQFQEKKSFFGLFSHEGTTTERRYEKYSADRKKIIQDYKAKGGTGNLSEEDIEKLIDNLNQTDKDIDEE